ncbi:LysE family translocator [Paenibacillus beijingensis]|uniref:Lysine transporter LysE n=1 Tax=Paenibacillus beijingensis TaxID=1126833 RepID=A0A0D5NF32_9BACL|nr:LysE family transporter [Paenibacillus beijingensis]AJY73740.1 lysine transporter LysE [Paenibacillus beijingensis]
MLILLKGILIGLSIAAPVGPIGVLCIKRTLNQGRLFGFVSGLGAASADALYGLIAAVGFNVITELLIGQQMWIRLFGGLFLCYLGYQAMKTNTKTNDSGDVKRMDRLTAAYVTTFFLTMTNPLTILSFLGVFAGIGTSGTMTLSSFQMVIGIFIGSMIWWLFLSIVTGTVRQMLNANAMRWINRLSGIVLIVFGVVSLVKMIGDLAVIQ